MHKFKEIVGSFLVIDEKKRERNHDLLKGINLLSAYTIASVAAAAAASSSGG